MAIDAPHHAVRTTYPPSPYGPLPGASAEPPRRGLLGRVHPVVRACLITAVVAAGVFGTVAATPIGNYLGLKPSPPATAPATQGGPTGAAGAPAAPEQGGTAQCPIPAGVRMQTMPDGLRVWTGDTDDVVALFKRGSDVVLNINGSDCVFKVAADGPVIRGRPSYQAPDGGIFNQLHVHLNGGEDEFDSTAYAQGGQPVDTLSGTYVYGGPGTDGLYLDGIMAGVTHVEGGPDVDIMSNGVSLEMGVTHTINALELVPMDGSQPALDVGDKIRIAGHGTVNLLVDPLDQLIRQ